MLDLKISWERFIDSLLEEWKTLNIISVLLLSYVLRPRGLHFFLMLEQRHPHDFTDSRCGKRSPDAQLCTLSLICALMSLLYGCMYIVRFGTIRQAPKAAAWAEVSCSRCSLYIPVLIMPTGRPEVYNIHLVECLGSPRNASNLARLVRFYRPSFICAMFLISSRSIILYIACILSFVWRTGTTNNERTYVLSPRAELGIRIAFSAVFGLGVMYFALMIRTFWQYGDTIDKSFKAQVAPTSNSLIYPGLPPGFFSYAVPFSPRKIMDLRFQSQDGNVMPQFLQSRFSDTSWWEFIEVPHYTCAKTHDAE